MTNPHSNQDEQEAKTARIVLDIMQTQSTYNPDDWPSEDHFIAAKIAKHIHEYFDLKVAPQPANPLPSEKCRHKNTFVCAIHNVLTCRDCGYDGYRENTSSYCDWVTDKNVAMPSTPIESDSVNAWMLANGWEWQDSGMKGVEGWWRKPNMDTVSQDLAAEMYRMSEVMVAEARIELLHGIQVYSDPSHQKVSIYQRMKHITDLVHNKLKELGEL